MTPRGDTRTLRTIRVSAVFHINPCSVVTSGHSGPGRGKGSRGHRAYYPKCAVLHTELHHRVSCRPPVRT